MNWKPRIPARPSTPKTFLFVLLLAAFLPTSQMGSSVPPKSEALWSASLAHDPDWKEAKATIDTNGYGYPQIEFVGADKVVVWFLHSANPTPRAGPGELREPLELKAFFFEAETGTPLTTLHWPARRRDANLMPTHDGGFLVRADGLLIFYSRDSKPQRQRPLLGTTYAPTYRPTYWEVEMAPGGRLAVLRFFDHGARKKTDTWVQADTFEEILSMEDPVRQPVIVAEDALIRNRVWATGKSTYESGVFLRERGEDWKPFVLPIRMGARLFVTNNLILMITGKNGFAVVSRRGEVLFEGKFDEHMSRVLKRSMNGNRFAIFDEKAAIPIIEKRDFFDARCIARVFDVKRKGLAWEKDFGIHDDRQVDLALSPDGSRLAVLTESTIRVFELPIP